MSVSRHSRLKTRAWCVQEIRGLKGSSRASAEQDTEMCENCSHNNGVQIACNKYTILQLDTSLSLMPEWSMDLLV